MARQERGHPARINPSTEAKRTSPACCSIADAGKMPTLLSFRIDDAYFLAKKILNPLSSLSIR
jgi:hypothetical protein